MIFRLKNPVNVCGFEKNVVSLWPTLVSPKGDRG